MIDEMTFSENTNKDEQAEAICRWAAARAGVIVIAPGVGALALIANEVYMIVRLGVLYEVEISETAATAFLMSLGASFVGQTMATFIPFAPIQIPIGVGVTYAVGKVAQQWIKAGMPKDMEQYKAQFKEVKRLAKNQVSTLLELQ
jgi:uncharacterized protein (DUF697 family)